MDTDNAAWSALDANDRSINLCFAGSSVNWSEDQWMQQSKAIDVAAYLCVQDCIKYGIATNVLVPPYISDPPGISDHKYVTQHLGSGTHVDCGAAFPWLYFQQRIAYWNQALTTTGPPPTQDQPDHPVVPYDPTQNAPLETLTQVRGRWGRLGKRTLVEAVGVILDKVTGEDNSKDDSFSW